MQILKERPFGTIGASYAWCKKCKGFVIALGKHCINNDKHLIDYLSPKERSEIPVPRKIYGREKRINVRSL